MSVMGGHVEVTGPAVELRLGCVMPQQDAAGA